MAREQHIFVRQQQQLAAAAVAVAVADASVVAACRIFAMLFFMYLVAQINCT